MTSDSMCVGEGQENTRNKWFLFHATHAHASTATAAGYAFFGGKTH